MNIQVERHKPLITKRIVFTSRGFPPPPQIARRMEFGVGSGRLRMHPTVTDVSEKAIRNRASTPSLMDIEPLSITRRSGSPKQLPPAPPLKMQANHQVNKSNTCFSKEPRSRTPNLTRARTPSEISATEVSSDLDSMTRGKYGVRFVDSDDESLASLSQCSEIEPPPLIPKPPGEAGRPQSGGYNLQEKLDWNERTYNSIIVSWNLYSNANEAHQSYRILCTNLQGRSWLCRKVFVDKIRRLLPRYARGSGRNTLS